MCVCVCVCGGGVCVFVRVLFVLDKFRVMLLDNFNSVRFPSVPCTPYRGISIARYTLRNAHIF